MGHIVDPLGYNKANYDQEYMKLEYSKAEPFLNVISQDPTKIDHYEIIRKQNIKYKKSNDSEPIPYNKNNVKARLKKFLTGEDDIVSEILSMSSTGHNEIVSNPKSIENNMPEFSNLIDFGLLIEIDNQYFQPIIKDNGYGFTDIGRKPFLSKEETILKLKNYELI